ncbi:MAG: hypothetical protein GXY44_09625 [Phycisphaerales bacterium]|nr:hypothetical protein [Phycisphaerales bacterium]
MDRRTFLKNTALTVGALAARTAAGKAASANIGRGDRIVISNPYEKVDWNTTQRHKAALHLHTLQSDGFQMVEEVVRAYHRAGYTIISITDHDWNEPNRRIVGHWGPLPAEQATPYPRDPKPDNFPANPTWPWTDYATPGPADLGLVGIKGNELSYKHHINSYYNDYGLWHGTPGDQIGHKAPYRIVDAEGREIQEDDQLTAIGMKGGLGILCHPSISDEHAWWERKSLRWYIERYRLHSSDYLIGMEITNNVPAHQAYDEGLWDQLLARFMPERPIWGFGNDDMHDLRSANQTFNMLFLGALSDTGVRKAMETGQFCIYRSTKYINYMMPSVEFSDFPDLKAIKIDQDSETISIEAVNYDEIKWISAPASLEPVEDYRTSNQPWPLGTVVHRGNTLDLRAAPGLRRYVRAEIMRKDGDHIHRIFTNPFGIVKS